MSQTHTGIISSSSDSAIKKIAVVDGSGVGLLMQPITPTFTIVHTQIGQSGALDDIQTLSLGPVPTIGKWFLIVQGKKTTALGRAVTAAEINTAMTTAEVTGVVASGGPLAAADIVFTTTMDFSQDITTSGSTLATVPYKWIPIARDIQYYDIISPSLYTSIPLWNTQGIYLSGRAATGQVTLTIGIGTDTRSLDPLGPKATAAQFRTAMALVTEINVADYEVYGGPWPAAIVVQFKNRLQYQSRYRFSVGTNTFDGAGLPLIKPIGKQILVSYHPQMKQHIVVRPGYV